MFNINQLKNPTSNSNWSWKCIVIGTFSLPLFPNLGALSFVMALINICSKEYKKLCRHPLTWCWGIFSVWLIITSCFAYKPSEAFLGLANFLPFMALFIAFRWVIREVEQLFLLAWLLIFSSIPIVMLGLSQLYLGWYSPDFLPPLIGWTLRINGVPEGRMSSVFIYANLLAIYLLISLILSIGLWIHSYQNCHKIRKKNLIYS